MKRFMLSMQIGWFFLLLMFILDSHLCYGKSHAYLIGTGGEILDLDAEADRIISTKKLTDISPIQTGKESVVADRTKNLLYVVYGRLTARVGVFDLRTLEFKKDLGIISGDPDVMIIAPSLSGKFYVDWWDEEKNGRYFTSFDTTSLKKISDITPFPVITDQIMYSEDNKKLYSINGGDPAKIDIYNTVSFDLEKTIPLGNVFTAGIFGRGISDQQNGKVLIVENVKTSKADPDRYTLYTYSIGTGMVSKKILTGMAGDSMLSPDGTRIILDEKQVIYSKDHAYIESEKSIGHLHVYDVATGNELGVVPFTVDSSIRMAGIHPNGNKLYGIGNVGGSRSLIVMDIVNFKVIKTLNIPGGSMFLIFSDQ